MSAAATYVYCLLSAPRPPALDDAPAGLACCAPPRLLGLGAQRWLVVADAPLEHYGAEAIQAGLRDLEWVGARALEHEAVVEHLLGAGTVVPMKLFTLYLGDERARAELGAREEELARVLDALAQKREWGVRVLLDPARAAAALEESAAESADGSAPGAGQAFLLRKKRVLEATRGLRLQLLERAQALHDELAELAADARSRPPLRGEGRLVLDASFLVPEAGEARFLERVRARTPELAEAGLELALSGPWPAYNFVEPAP